MHVHFVGFARALLAATLHQSGVLSELDISHNDLQLHDMAALAHAFCCMLALHVVDVAGNRLTGNDMRTLAPHALRQARKYCELATRYPHTIPLL